MTAFHRNGKTVWLIGDCHGRWVTTGVAKDWPRCTRCRRPEHMMPENSGLCTTCYYYHALPKGEFWNRQNDYLFPYNIGARSMKNTFDRQPLEDPKVKWRTYLRTQQPQFH